MNKKINFLFVLTFIINFCAVCFAENIKKQETTIVQKSKAKPAIPEPDKKLEVTYKGGKLYVFSRSVTVGEVFAEIAKQAKIEIKVDEETSKGKMTYQVNNKELKQGIEEILNIIGLRDLAISYKEKEIDSKGKKVYVVNKVEIRKRNKEEIAKVEEEEGKKRQEDYKQKEKAYHELFKDMGKKGKIAGMLKDYVDGKKSSDVETYLRQATIKPEDKELLKSAYSDPKYNKLASSIEMAIIHSISDHPEENDKEFLLERLKKKEGGFLLYSMKFIWDEKFIPELIKWVKDPSLFPIYRSTAAEILGARNVKEAVPALEEALLNSRDDEDCTQILHALSCITGLNYYIQNGKLKTTTEKPKLGPMIIKPVK